MIHTVKGFSIVNEDVTFRSHLIKHLDAQAGFRKGRGTRDQTANVHWIIENARAFRFIDYAKTFDCVDHKKLENS